MARNSTLTELLTQLRAECRLSSATSQGLDHREYLIQVLKRHYEALYTKYDWPFLRINRDDAGTTLAAGQRYYDFPDDLNYDKDFEVWHKYGGTWIPLAYGITPDEYSSQDSDEDERSDPAQRWDFYDEGQIEIWPLPSTDGGEIRFVGTRVKTELNENNDRCDLDDTLVVLHAAAEVLAANDKKDASIKGQLAVDRLNTLRAVRAGGTKLRFGCGQEARQNRTIRVARVSS